MPSSLVPAADDRPTLSRLRARGRVGADFFARIGAQCGDGVAAPAGLVDRIEDLASPATDAARLDPAVQQFFLAPCALRLRVHSTWHGAFALAWRLLRPLLGAVGQFYLPRDHAVIDTRTVALDAARDGRPGVRGVVRTYVPGGAVMQLVAYATHRGPDGAGYMSAAFPLPAGALCGVLRLELIGEHGVGARLTSRRRDRAFKREPVGIWFAPLRGPAFALPLEETLELWPARAPDAPPDLRDGARPGDTLVGRHVQRLYGLRFATHAYWFSPRA